MKNYFIDTNVIIDMLADREGFADAACAIFDSAEKGDVNLYVCSLSYSNIYYIIRRAIGHEATIEALKELSTVVSILPVDNTVIEDALNSEFKDFEDAIQYFSAFHSNIIDGIITRNPKDFKLSEIPILSPTEFA